MRTGWLYRTEARGIQGYVLGTEKLREIAGASALVKSIDAAIRERVGGGGEVVYVAAGRAEIVFSDRAAMERFMGTWPLVVSRVAPGLEVTQAAVELEELEGEPYRRARNRLGKALQAERERPAPRLPEAGPWLARSGRTGEPAVYERDRWITRDGSVDAATRAKLRAARAIQDAFEEAIAPRGRSLATDEGELGEGYVAVVHADGNEIGKLFIDASHSAQSVAALSESLRAATEHATKAAVRALAERIDAEHQRTVRVLPVRPVVLGGDDLTVIVAARHAIAFTEAFLRAFERESAERLGDRVSEGLSAAAGIAFVKPGFQFRRAYDLAEALCSAAKARARNEGGRTPSALMFHRVTGATTTRWDAIEARELSVQIEREGRALMGTLAGGPWTLERLDRLRALARALGRLPRGAVRGWLELVRRDPGLAEVHLERIYEVLGEDDERYGELARALAELGVDRKTWFEQEGAREPIRSPILDALTWLGLDPALLRSVERDKSEQEEALSCGA